MVTFIIPCNLKLTATITNSIMTAITKGQIISATKASFHMAFTDHRIITVIHRSKELITIQNDFQKLEYPVS